MSSLGILGAGTWGMALARMLSYTGYYVTVWSAIKKEIDDFSVSYVYPNLPGMRIPEGVAMDMPTTIVSACEDLSIVERVQDIFMNTCMRGYTNADKRGVELCGAMKNIIALATGISAGLGYGDNAKAALITRGMAEITRLGTAMGCMEQTFAGLAGLGDLIVTAVNAIINHSAEPSDTVKELMGEIKR